MEQKDPKEILATAVRVVEADLNNCCSVDGSVISDINIMVSSLTKAPIRILLTAMIVKIAAPSTDIRKPFSSKKNRKGELSLFDKSDDSYSGRTFDEKYVSDFIFHNKLNLPKTTGFLTPAFRTKKDVLTRDIELNGRNPESYRAAIDILNKVQDGALDAVSVLHELVRQLVNQRNKNKDIIQSKLDKLSIIEDENFIPLSSEHIVNLIAGQFSIAGASRLPVLLITAAYKCIEGKIGEKVLPLNAHNAADSQTGSLGDVEITLTSDDKVVTVYEMKMKRVFESDINSALSKLDSKGKIDNYIFITTAVIDPIVESYAKDLYNACGIEFVILDCIGFIRHFLHLFHRHRVDFLNFYQELILSEPDNDVSLEQKELWLSARIAAEAQNKETYAKGRD